MADSSQSITIVLVDDHAVVRHGLRALFGNEKSFQVVGEASDGLEAVRLVQRLQPHVAVVDLMIPGLNGLEVVRQIGRTCPDTRVLILSMHANEAYLLEALRNKATGYALKDAKPSDIIEAVRAVAAGRRYLSPPLSETAVESYEHQAQSPLTDAYDTLTTREREVLQLTAEGYTAAQIGARLFISPRTVEIHRAHFMRKLSLRNQVDVIRYAIKKGFLSAERPLDLVLASREKS
jgi:two-component system, NarL family, response regulator NreC